MTRAQSPTHVRKLIGGSFLPPIILMAVALLPMVPAVASWDHHRDEKAEIIELEQQWRTATLNSDVPAMDKLLSEDYVGISWTGQVNNKMSQLDRIRLHHLTVTRMDISDVKVKIVGAVAIVTSSAEVEGVNDSSPMSGTFRYTRVYQQLPNGGWKITNFEATRVPNGPRGRGRRMPPPAGTISPPSSTIPPAVPPPTLTA